MGAAPLILVSNDDGIHSEGIAALAEALRNLGEVVVAARCASRSSRRAATRSTAPRPTA
jgi:broad specificity polyphosphatase/5'/3'-nucleotidase SurE